MIVGREELIFFEKLNQKQERIYPDACDVGVMVKENFLRIHCNNLGMLKGVHAMKNDFTEVTLHCRCEREGHVFEANPKYYPVSWEPSYEYNKDGDQTVTCPKCGREYMLYDDEHAKEFNKIGLTGGMFWSDRALTILSVHPRVYREGDTFVITAALQDRILKSEHRDAFSRQHVYQMYAVGTKCTCRMKRLDRIVSQMTIQFSNGNWTNVYAFEKAGMKFEETPMPVLDPMTCEEKYLSTTELVTKEIAKARKCSYKAAEQYLGVVLASMGKHEIVFYRP